MKASTWIAISLMILAIGGCAVPDDKASAPAAEAVNICGGIAGKQCAAGLYGDFGSGTASAPSTCGSGDQTGRCAPIPEVCLAIYQPVCGCDAKTYSSDCGAHSKGISVARPGECPATE